MMLSTKWVVCDSTKSKIITKKEEEGTGLADKILFPPLEILDAIYKMKKIKKSITILNKYERFDKVTFH